jgi:hypothetical protein
MLPRSAFAFTLFAILLACPAESNPSEAPQQSEITDAGVTCRALEVHSDAATSLTVVVFHHASESSRGPLAALLHEHSGAAAEVELQGEHNKSWQGTIFRLKSCFGRGLAFFPVNVPIKEGGVFRLRITGTQASEPEKNNG